MAALTEPIRSFLFVPGNKDSWIEKSVGLEADALILDLEDSVPPEQKVQARAHRRDRKLEWLAARKQRNWVRINRSPHLYDFEDILAIVGPHLEGVFVSSRSARRTSTPSRRCCPRPSTARACRWAARA